MGPRVYLVEDSAIIVRLLRDAIREVGAVVVGHSDGASLAIADIGVLRPDVVVIDITLREGSGFDVISALRKRLGPKGPIQIILSNYVLKPYREAAKRLNVEYFFDKGSQIPQMLRVLQALPRMADKPVGG